MLAVVLAAVVALSAPRGVEAQGAVKHECEKDPLGPVPDWDMVVLGDVNWKAGETEGRAVVGRDARFESSASARGCRSTARGWTSRSAVT